MEEFRSLRSSFFNTKFKVHDNTMRRNEKDLIGFHKLLNATIEARGISLETACRGLFSDTNLSLVRTGKRLPDYLMRNRIMARLGISSEQYDDFVHAYEYDCFLKRCQIMDLMESGKILDAEEQVFNGLSEVDKENKCELQFYLDMKARIMFFKKESSEEIAKIYEEAVSLTMPNIDFGAIDKYVLAPVEYFLLIQLLNAKGNIADEGEKHRLLKLYANLCNSISSNYEQDFAKSKAYAAAVCGWYDLLESISDIGSDVLWDIYKNSGAALEALRDAGKSYYLLNLLKLRRDLRMKLSIRDDKSKQEKRWLEIFSGLYRQFDIDSDMRYSCYIYMDSTVYSIPKVIRSRRKLFGWSQKKLAEGICTERTLIRIENEKNAPQQHDVRFLFDRLNMLADYRRGNVITDKFSVLMLYDKYTKASLDCDYNKALEYIDELEKSIDLGIVINHQLLDGNRYMQLHAKGEMSADEYNMKQMELLSYTLPDDPNYQPDSYLSQTENTLLVRSAYKLKNPDIRKLLLDRCTKYYAMNIRNHIRAYELIMGFEASDLGDEGEYSKSNAYSIELIKYALRFRRVNAIRANLYNILWNTGKANPDYSKNAVEKELLKCADIAEYNKQHQKYDWYMKKIEKVRNNEDWTR